MRDYNAAFGLQLPGLAAAATGYGTADQASAAPATDGELLPSHVSPADILAHVADIASYCRRIDAQLDAVIALQIAQAKPEDETPHD